MDGHESEQVKPEISMYEHVREILCAQVDQRWQKISLLNVFRIFRCPKQSARSRYIIAKFLSGRHKCPQTEETEPKGEVHRFLDLLGITPLLDEGE